MNEQRPDGQTATGIGWALIVGGVLAVLVAGADDSGGAGWLIWLAVANLGIGLGVLLLSLGYLVRAIWFLPGREIPVEGFGDESFAPLPCDWCGQTVASPNKPCAAFDPERLKTFVPRITNDKCLVALRDQGLIEADG